MEVFQGGGGLGGGLPGLGARPGGGGGRGAGGGGLVHTLLLPGRASVPLVLMAPAASVASVGPRFPGAGGPPGASVVGGAAGAPPLVTTATGPAATPLPLVVVMAREASGGALLGLHLVGGFAISLGKLDLDLAPAHPLPVQVVEGIFSVSDVLELNVSKSSWSSRIEVKRNVDIYNRSITTKLTT